MGVTCCRLFSASASFSNNISWVSGGDCCPSNILSLFGGCFFTTLSSSSVNGTLNATAVYTHTHVSISKLNV